MGMRVRLRLGLGAIVAVCAFPANAAAEETTCQGTIAAQTLDNVRVPQGAECVLAGTYVQGTVKIEQDATLRARGVRVVGNVQGENARRVNVVRRSRVGGSVQVVQGGAAQVRRSRINGDILYDENNEFLRVRRTRVGGSVQAFQNNGGIEIVDNTINGNLQCKENEPAPTGGGNQVGGTKEDQCATL
jgi:hypothetical protein